MSQTIYTPGVNGDPYGNLNSNPEGSNYPSDSEFSPTETNLIRKSIERSLFDAAPKEYAAMKILFQKPVMEVPLDEFEYLEFTFGRNAVVADVAAVAAVVAVPGSSVTTTFNATAASIEHMRENDVLTFSDNSEAIVDDITGVAVTLRSLVNEGLSAINTGDSFSVRSTITADYEDSFHNYSRLDTITRYNYVQFFLRAQRWGRIELVKWENNGTTDYLKHDKKEKIKQLRYDMFISFWNGHRGEYTMSTGRAAKSMGGIFPRMVAAGSSFSNSTLGSLASDFEAQAFATNHKARGEKMYIYGTNKSLHELSKIYKLSNVRYQTNDMKVNLDLGQIELGGKMYVLVPCELWREPSCFPADWADRLIVLDQDTVTPVKMRGIPLTEMGQTDNLQRGSREQFTDFWCKGQLSLKFNNPLASFYINIV